MTLIKRHFGSKRGALRLAKTRLLHVVGGYNTLKDIDFSRVERLVFVCKGNICRSPYAELMARKAGLNTASCGIDAAPGSPANEMALHVAGQLGHPDMAQHRSSRLDQGQWQPTDLLIGMEPAHLPAMQQAASANSAQVTLLGLWSPSPRPYLHDPYGGSEEYFLNCFRYIQGCVGQLAQQAARKGGRLASVR